MVERDNEPPSPGASGGLSADEADRLAERFRPSWERDDVASTGARRAAKQTLIGIAPLSSAPPPNAAPPPSVAPVSPRPNSISSAAASPNSSLPPGVLAPTTARAPRPEGEQEKPAPRERPIGKQTLMGIAPIPAAPARKEGVDDLPAPAVPGVAPAPAPAPLTAANPRAVKSQADLPPPPPIPAELSAPPPAPAVVDRGAAAAVSFESTRPPLSEPPRGIVAPYQPKDDPSGPAVVLKDDVLAMEEAQAATEELLREHEVSSRRAPTIMNLKAPSVSAYPGPTPDFTPTPQRSKRPLVIGGVVLALGAALIVVVAFAFKGESNDASAAAPVSPVASVVTSPVAPPATLEVPPPLPPEAPAEAPAARESEAEPRAAATDRKPPAKKSASKAPSKAFAKPASGTTAPKKSGVIVRDTPF